MSNNATRSCTRPKKRRREIKYINNILSHDQPLRKPSTNQPWRKMQTTFIKHLLMTKVIDAHNLDKKKSRKKMEKAWAFPQNIHKKWMICT
jgi:hypothetical protein